MAARAELYGQYAMTKVTSTGRTHLESERALGCTVGWTALRLGGSDAAIGGAADGWPGRDRV